MYIQRRTLVAAVVIVSTAMAGTYAMQDRMSTWLSGAFLIPIWQPLFIVLALKGGPHGASWTWFDTLLVFVVALLYWVALIEGGRWVWRRIRAGATRGDGQRL